MLGHSSKVTLVCQQVVSEFLLVRSLAIFLFLSLSLSLSPCFLIILLIYDLFKKAIIIHDYNKASFAI
jgi:hypothetical protein